MRLTEKVNDISGAYFEGKTKQYARTYIYYHELFMFNFKCLNMSFSGIDKSLKVLQKHETILIFPEVIN